MNQNNICRPYSMDRHSSISVVYTAVVHAVVTAVSVIFLWLLPRWVDWISQDSSEEHKKMRDNHSRVAEKIQDNRSKTYSYPIESRMNFTHDNCNDLSMLNKMPNHNHFVCSNTYQIEPLL